MSAQSVTLIHSGRWQDSPHYDTFNRLNGSFWKNPAVIYVGYNVERLYNKVWKLTLNYICLDA